MAHVRTVERFDSALAAAAAPSVVINLGTGRGVTVREPVDVAGQVLGRPVPVREMRRRPGDVTGSYAKRRPRPPTAVVTAASSLQDGVASAFALAERRASVLGYSHPGRR